MATIFISLVVLLLFEQMLIGASLVSSTAGQVVHWSVIGMQLALIILLLKEYLVGKSQREASKKAFGVHGATLWIVALVIINITLQTIGFQLNEYFRWDAKSREVATDTALIFGLKLAIVAPLVEELIFRGYLLRWFCGKYGPAFAVAATSSLFGVIHGLNVAGAINAIFGVGLAASVIRFGTILPAIIVHVTCNLIGLALYFGGVVSLH